MTKETLICPYCSYKEFKRVTIDKVNIIRQDYDIIDEFIMELDIKFYCFNCKKVIEESDLTKSVSFVVNSKDLFDKSKNPNLSLSPKEILANKRIKKVMF